MANEKNQFLIGTAIVIDDEILLKDSSINKLINKVENLGSIFIKFDNLPNKALWESFQQVSYIILDWDIKQKSQESLPENVELGRTFVSAQKMNIKEFLKYVLGNYFMPIFIFSQENIIDIKSALKEDPIIKSAIEKNQIIVESKSNLQGNKIKSYFNKWIKSSNSVLTLKLFDKEICRAKNALFIKMNSINNKWVDAIYETIKKDKSEDPNMELNEFILSLLISRINDVDLSTIKYTKRNKFDEASIKNIYNASKFIEYNSTQNIKSQHPGDIYQRVGESDKSLYYINIIAPCDARYDRMLLISCDMPKTLPKLVGNTVIDKANEFSISLFLGKKVLVCKLNKYERIKKTSDCNKILINNVEYIRIGRLVHPYITALIKKFSEYISRQGLPVHPVKRIKE